VRFNGLLILKSQSIENLNFPSPIFTDCLTFKIYKERFNKKKFTGSFSASDPATAKLSKDKKTKAKACNLCV